jgi:hypothetical protein
MNETVPQRSENETALPSPYATAPLPVLGEAIYTAEERLAALDQAHAEATQELRDDITLMRSYLAARMVENDQKIVPHDELQITCKVNKSLEKRMDILLGLRDLISKEDYERAFTVKITFSIPPSLKEPIITALSQWINPDSISVTTDADGRIIKTFNTYGKAAKEIIENGMPQLPKGAPVLTIIPKQPALRNVTPKPETLPVAAEL